MSFSALFNSSGSVETCTVAVPSGSRREDVGYSIYICKYWKLLEYE